MLSLIQSDQFVSNVLYSVIKYMKLARMTPLLPTLLPHVEAAVVRVLMLDHGQPRPVLTQTVHDHVHGPRQSLAVEALSLRPP